MEHIDQGEESRRLQEFYARMSESELRAVADEGYDLAELARYALQGEISRRGLSIELRNAPVDDFDPTGLDLCKILGVTSSSEASLAVGLLNSAGIPAYLGPDHIESVGAFKGEFEDGVEIHVRKEDLMRAHEVIDPYFPVRPEDRYEHICVCPKCHAPDITFQNLDAAWVDGLRADSKFNWTCDACGHHWKDDGFEREP
jgi:hypothetical protein